MIKWIILIVIAILAVRAIMNRGKKAAGPTSTGTAGNPRISVFSMTVDHPQAYSTVLNGLEQIVEQVIRNSFCEVSVVVQVKKLDSTFCQVSCSLLADTSFNGIAFGEGFACNGNDHAAFETGLATGFSTAQDVKREILLQFSWSDISVSNTQLTVLDRGDYADKPYVSYSFTGKKG
jgi:hypothetical protein